MYLVPGLQFQEKYLTYLEERYRFNIIRVPHWQLGEMFRFGSYAPHTKIRFECPQLEIKDIEQDIREQTGIRYICYGSRKSDSLERSAMIGSCGGINEEAGRIYPIADFTTKDVMQYLRLRKIPLAPEYAYMKRSFGRLWDEELMMIRTHWPEDYERIREVFPYVEAAIQRKQFAERAAGQ